MLALKIFKFLGGYARIRVTGGSLERFVNLAISQGIVMWEVSRTGNIMYANIGISSFFSLRPVARKSGCRVHIIERRGFPFAIGKIKRRKAWIVGSLLLLCAMIYVSSFVWTIEVRGTKNVDPERVIESAARNGLRVGVPRKSVDVSNVERRMFLEIKEVSWIGIRFQGTRAIIEVMEKDMPPKTQNGAEYADIVASKPGLVRRLILINGEPRVAEGDAVVPGQILISGTVTIARPADAPPTSTLVRAKGIVEAQVWYEEYRQVKISREVLERTGRMYRRLGLNPGNGDIIWLGSDRVPFTRYTMEDTRVPLLKWRNAGKTVELINRVYHELINQKQTLTYPEAKEEARQECMRALDARIPPSAERTKITSSTDQGDGWVGVKVIVETVEDIGVEMDLNGGSP